MVIFEKDFLSKNFKIALINFSKKSKRNFLKKNFTTKIIQNNSQKEINRNKNSQKKKSQKLNSTKKIKKKNTDSWTNIVNSLTDGRICFSSAFGKMVMR